METAIFSSNLATRIEHAIFHNPHLNHWGMHLKMRKGHIVIEGKVASFFEKQMAQEAVKNIQGVNTIDNRLIVD